MLILFLIFTGLTTILFLKLLNFRAKPVAKAMLPLALTFGAYQGVEAQNYAAQKGTITVVLEDELSESLGIEKKITYGPYGQWETSSRHLDVLKVYNPSSGHNYSLLYMGDLSWTKGDTLYLEVAAHKELDAEGKRSRVWTDEELVDYYLGENLVIAATPDKKRFHNAVITDILDIKSGKKD